MNNAKNYSKAQNAGGKAGQNTEIAAKKPSASSFFSAVIYGKQLVPRGCSIKYYNAFDMIYHTHKRIEIVYVVTGETHVCFADENGLEHDYILHSNEYAFIDADVLHKIRVDDVATQFLNVEFSLETPSGEFLLLSAYTREKNLQKLFAANKRVIKLSDDGTLMQLSLLIQSYTEKHDKLENDGFLNYLTTALLLSIAESYKKRTENLYGISYLNIAFNYITDNYNVDFSVEDVAKAANVSQNYLNLLFKKKFGVTVSKFVNNFRIEKARMLLTDTDLNIDEVRKQVGFNNKMNFNRNFYAVTGMSPREYRKNETTATKIHLHEKFMHNEYSI